MLWFEVCYMMMMMIIIIIVIITIIIMLIHIYLVRLGNHQDVFVMVSVVDITQRFRMVSVVGFLLWFPSSQETFFLFYGFRRFFFFIVSVAAGNDFLWFPSRNVF